MTQSTQPHSNGTNTGGPWLLLISGGLALLCLALAPAAIDDWQTARLSAAELLPAAGISVVHGTVTVVTTRVRSVCLKIDDTEQVVCPATPPLDPAAPSFAGQRAKGYYKAGSNRLLSLQLATGQEIVSISAGQSALKGPLKSLFVLAALAASGLAGATLLIARNVIKQGALANESSKY